MQVKWNEKTRQNANGLQKRAKLLNVAGKVFAERGYHGSRVRDVSNAAKVSPSALIYHFGTKKELFYETLRHHIMDNSRLPRLFDAFLDADPKKPQSVSDAVYESVRALLEVCHGKKRVANLNGLLICMLTEAGREANSIFQRLGHNSMNIAFEKIKQANPALTDEDLFWWSHMFWARIFYPVGAKDILLSAIDKKDYSEEFVAKMAYRFALQCCLPMGLPAPSAAE